MDTRSLILMGALIGLSGWNAGCAATPATPSYELDIEGGLNGRQMGIVAEAAEQWTWATGGLAQFKLVGYPGPDTITIYGRSDAEMHAQFTPNTLGYTLCSWDRNDSHIWLTNDVDNYAFELIVKHELGHALGLKHSGPDTLMCPYNSCASHDVTCEDVKQFCSIWGCEAASMPVCSPHLS